jgi:hypothetical protein
MMLIAAKLLKQLSRKLSRHSPRQPASRVIAKLLHMLRKSQWRGLARAVTVQIGTVCQGLSEFQDS